MKIRLDVSCESSAKQRIHKKYKVLFSQTGNIFIQQYMDSWYATCYHKILSYDVTIQLTTSLRKKCQPNLFYRFIYTRNQTWYNGCHMKRNLKSCTYSKHTNEPVHLCKLIRIFTFHFLVSPGFIYCKLEIERIWLDCSDVQADLSLPFSQMP